MKAFAANSNVSDVAKEVVNKCKYIHPSKMSHVESLLNDLKHRLSETPTEKAVVEPEASSPKTPTYKSPLESSKEDIRKSTPSPTRSRVGEVSTEPQAAAHEVGVGWGFGFEER